MTPERKRKNEAFVARVAAMCGTMKRHAKKHHARQGQIRASAKKLAQRGLARAA